MRFLLIFLILFTLFTCSDDSKDEKKISPEEQLAKQLSPIYELMLITTRMGAYEVVSNKNAMGGKLTPQKTTACPAITVQVSTGKIGIEYDDTCEPIQGNLYMTLNFEDLITKFELTIEIDYDSIRTDDVALVGAGEMSLKGNEITFKLINCKAYTTKGNYTMDSELTFEIDLNNIESFSDDEVLVTGDAKLTTADNQEYSMEIKEELKFTTDCIYIRQGIMRIMWNNIYADFDFYPDNGECDTQYNLDIGFN